MSADVPAHLQLREVLGDIMPKHRATWGDSHEWAALLDFQTALGAAGWAAPGWPVEYGGKGLSVEELTACAAEFYKARCPRQIAVFGTANVGPTIMVNGTAEQKKYLARMLTAEDVWCQGFSEPDFGSDLAGLKTKAEIDGDEFVINGAKIWTSVGLNATHCMLLVRTDPDAPKHKGISALLIRLDLPGIDRRPIKQLNGLSEFAEMHFDNVRVPRSALLGPLHAGWGVTMNTLGFERSGVLAMAGQLADEVAEVTAPGRFDDATAPVRQEAMHLYSAALILSWMGERSLSDVSPEGVPGPLSTLIKLAWSKLAMRLGEFRVDHAGIAAVAGAQGETAEAADAFLMARSAGIAGGTTEVLKNLIAERALGMPKEPGLR